MVIGFEVCLKDVLVTSSAMTLTTIPGSGGILSFLVGFGFSGFEKMFETVSSPYWIWKDASFCHFTEWQMYPFISDIRGNY